MLLDSVTIFCSTTETTIMKYNVFPCIWTFYYCLQYHCMVKGFVTHPSALLSCARVYVSKGEYFRTEEKCMLVPVVLSIIWCSLTLSVFAS